MIDAIITDIEGTTSSLAFVKDVLFPYARRNMARFVRAHADDSEVRALLDAVRQYAPEAESLEAVIDQLDRWMAEDQKITPLKSLQGLLWRHAYEQGALHGHIYPDAVEALRRWHAQGIALYVYSSGSVLAQKLLFGHSEAGDMTPLFSGFFDTHLGNKKDSASYRRILETINRPAQRVLFLSDSVEELDAAREAGLHTVQLCRDGASPASPHRQVTRFTDIDLRDFAS